MNINLLFHQAVIGTLSVLLVFISYQFSKYYVSYYRKDEKNAATKREKIVSYIYCVAWVFGSSLLAAFVLGRDYLLIPRVFFISVIPSIFGMMKGYERDIKLTAEEREKLKFDLENTKPYDKSSYSDNVG